MKLAVRYRFRRNAERLRSHLARARFFRGHGVHSPFVYAIVRQVFMKTELAEGDRSLYAALRERDVNERRAVQLQNLFIHCGYWKCHWISESVTFFKSIQEYLWNFSKKLAQ